MSNMKTLLVTEHDDLEIHHYYSVENRFYIIDSDNIEKNGPKFHDMGDTLFACSIIPEMVSNDSTIEKMSIMNENGKEEFKYSMRVGTPQHSEYVLSSRSSTVIMDLYKRILKLRYSEIEDYLEEHPEYEI